MLCPYCGSQNPDDAPLCSSCNAVLTESAQPPTPQAPNYAEAPAAPAPYGGPAMQPAPGQAPGAAEPPKKGGKAKWVVLIVLGGVALMGIIAALVAFVTCSAINASKFSLDDLVKGEPEKVAKSIEGLEIVKLYDTAYYAPASMKDTVSKACAAFDEGSRNKADKLAGDIKEMSPWAVAVFKEGKNDDDDGYRPFESLKLVNLQDGADPAEAAVFAYRVLDNPTAEDIYKIAQEVVQIDEITIGSNPTQDAEQYYGENIYYVGHGKGPNTTLFLRVDKLNDVYEIGIYAYNNDEIKGKGISRVDKSKEIFDDSFKSKETFPEKK